MKKYLKLLKAVSERREALNKYLSDAPPDKRDESRVTELRGDLDKAESEFRTAVDTDDAEGDGNNETRQLSDRIELRNYLRASLDGVKVTGAEAEFNKEVGIPDMNTVPWEALEDRQETQADNVTTVADAALAHPRSDVLRRVFRMSRTAFMGMRMPSVASGEPVYPVITGSQRAVQADQGSLSGADVEAKAFAQGSSVEAGKMEFTGIMVAPTRLSARYKFQMEDAAKFAGLEDILRSDLRMVMSDLLDEQIFNGNGTAPNMNGLFRNHANGPLGAWPTALNDAEVYNVSGTNLATVNKALDSFTDYVDGVWISGVDGIRTLIGYDTYKVFERAVSVENPYTIGSLLRRESRTFATWAGTPKAAALAGKNSQRVIQTRRGEDMVVPIWQGVTIIRDIYSGAAKAEVALTAHMLANSALLRSDNWRGITYQLEA